MKLDIGRMVLYCVLPGTYNLTLSTINSGKKYIWTFCLKAHSHQASAAASALTLGMDTTDFSDTIHTKRQLKFHWKVLMQASTLTLPLLLMLGVNWALMTITNFAIVLKFLRAKCGSAQNDSTESSNQALVKSATRGTAMVFIVSFTFLILTAPVGVDNALTKVIRLGQIPLYRVFMNSTQYLNHSINGLLYCIVGSRFRSELLQLICRKERFSCVFGSDLTNNS